MDSSGRKNKNKSKNQASNDHDHDRSHPPEEFPNVPADFSNKNSSKVEKSKSTSLGSKLKVYIFLSRFFLG